jgi:hypothetical protein
MCHENGREKKEMEGDGKLREMILCAAGNSTSHIVVEVDFLRQGWP